MCQVLSGLYTKTLSALQKLPKEAAYRRNTEQIVQQRLQIVQSVKSLVNFYEINGVDSTIIR